MVILFFRFFFQTHDFVYPAGNTGYGNTDHLAYPIHRPVGVVQPRRDRHSSCHARHPVEETTHFNREFAIRHQHRRRWDTSANHIVPKVGASRRGGFLIRPIDPALRAKVPLRGAGYCLLWTQTESALPLLAPPSRRGLPRTRQAHPS